MKFLGTKWEIRPWSDSVLLRGIQLAFVQWFQQLSFVIHYCCDNTRKVHSPNAGMRSGAPNMYWPHLKHYFHS
jgi:hypothetical protein